jgi:hypothetical protein
VEEETDRIRTTRSYWEINSTCRQLILDLKFAAIPERLFALMITSLVSCGAEKLA